MSASVKFYVFAYLNDLHKLFEVIKSVCMLCMCITISLHSYIGVDACMEVIFNAYRI